MGCASQVRYYAKNVTAFQHEVVVRLIDAEFDMIEDDPRMEKLWDLEENLNKECGPLQKATRLKLDQQEVPRDLGYEVAITLKDCEKAVFKLDNALRRYGY